MLRRVGTPGGGEDDCVGGGCSASFARCGDDDCLEEDAPRPLGLGGDDDCVGGRDTLVSQPIAREQASACDYRKWRELATDWREGLGGSEAPSQ